MYGDCVVKSKKLTKPDASSQGKNREKAAILNAIYGLGIK